MKLRDWAQGSSVFLAVIVAGYVSTSYVDQRFASIGTHAPANGPAPTADHPASLRTWARHC